MALRRVAVNEYVIFSERRKSLILNKNLSYYVRVNFCEENYQIETG